MDTIMKVPARVREIPDRIDPPIIDAAAHVIEGRFALHDFVKQVADPDVLKRLEAKKARRGKGHRSGCWASPNGK